MLDRAFMSAGASAELSLGFLRGGVSTPGCSYVWSKRRLKCFAVFDSGFAIVAAGLMSVERRVQVSVVFWS